MPRKVIAFACAHNCGRNVLTGRKRMERHEAICNWNPAMRACITCAHFSGGDRSCYDPEDYYGGASAGCEKDHNIAAKLRNECPDWEDKRTDSTETH